MSNTITAYFKGRIGVAEAVYQNDYGIVMAFDSIDLPAHFECFFSKLNQEEAVPGLGADSRVAIPNSVLADPGNVTIHIPLHTGEDDSEVEYVIYFKVIGRARPIDDGTPAQMTAIERALALLSQPITNIEEIVNEALSFTGDTFDEMKAELQEDFDNYTETLEGDLATWKGGVESDIDDVEHDFTVLQNQFDTAVAAVSTDTELTDIRVGDDEVTYTTAGLAVRTQFANLKSDISPLYDAINTIDVSKCYKTNSAVVYNGDGTYTVGTTDYGRAFFGTSDGSAIHFDAGTYYLFGTSQGFTFVSTTANESTAIAMNTTGETMAVTIDTAGDYYIGFRISSAPSEAFTITPFFNVMKPKVDDALDRIETLEKQYYTLTPTGDSTNRAFEIATILSTHKAVYLTEGEYTIATKLTLPSGSKLIGAGKSSVIKFASGSTGQMIECGNDCQISNLKFDGGLSSKPADNSANRHGIRVLDNTQTLQLSDCWIVGFGGSGLRISNTGYAQLSSIQINNCYFQYNGVGIYFLEHGEYGVVTNCSLIDNHIGIYLNGGNNIVNGCAIERNTIGASVNGNAIDNSGHGAFIGCSFNHNTNIGAEVLNTSNGYLFSGCQFFRNDNYEISINCIGVNVVGCNFGMSSHLRFTTDCVASLDGCVFASSPTVSYTNDAITRCSNCYKFDGTPISILRPGYRDFNISSPGAMLTIIDDDGHKKFYEDLLPIIESKKVPISSAIYNTSIGVADNTMTWEQVQECYEKGAEILSHSYDHADSTDMQSRTENEIQRYDQMAKNGLLSKGYYGGNYLVYAGATGSISKVKKAAQNVYACALTSTGNEMNFIDRVDPYYLKRYRIEVDYGYTLSTLKDLIDACISAGGWMIWMIHTSGDAWDSSAVSAISGAIDYALQEGLPIVTVDAGCRKMKIV